ncbi:hypothetical protein ACIO3O_06290 [Streptomyces sp. NPDC087440]|uniref:hypothetical protein n=1 Tax=Streptomyces sp. NPDC087440 TaxID=3365790 RepID=UPI0037FFF530
MTRRTADLGPTAAGPANSAQRFPTWGPQTPLGALRASADHDPAAKWIRLAAVLVLVPAMLFVLMLLGLSPMALDHCEPADPCYGEITGRINVAFVSLIVGAVPFLASLALPSHRKFRAARGFLVAATVAALALSLGSLWSL